MAFYFLLCYNYLVGNDENRGKGPCFTNLFSNKSSAPKHLTKGGNDLRIPKKDPDRLVICHWRSNLPDPDQFKSQGFNFACNF